MSQVGHRIRYGTESASYYDIPLCKKVVLLHQRVFGTSAYPHFVNGLQFQQTSESFGLVPLGPDLALDLGISLISDSSA